jgi:Na+-driven multidrug efflux pump
LIVLLPKLGILGAAFASVVGHGIQFTVMAWGFSRKNLRAKQAAISNSVPGRKTLPT